MGNVINLDRFRKKTQKKEDDTTKQRFKDSLDNDAVMRRYGIDKIQKRIDTINSLMKELERINKGEEKGK